MATIVLHFMTGMVTGSVFRVRALLALVGVVLLECVAAAAIVGPGAALWSAGGLIAIQVGYLVGVWLRAVLVERSLTPPSASPHHER